MSQPLDQAILDMIRATPVGPMPDRPVNDILRDMGLPPLPDLPRCRHCRVCRHCR